MKLKLRLLALLALVGSVALYVKEGHLSLFNIIVLAVAAGLWYVSNQIQTIVVRSDPNYRPEGMALGVLSMLRMGERPFSDVAETLLGEETYRQQELMDAIAELVSNGLVHSRLGTYLSLTQRGTEVLTEIQKS